MSQPVIIWEKWNADSKSTVLRVDIAFVASLCSYLKKNKGVVCKCSEMAEKKWGIGRDNKRWEIITNEVIVPLILKPDDLEGWDALVS